MNQSITSADVAVNEPILSPHDVERLLSDDSSESRTSLLEKISKIYNADLFQAREREIAEQVFRMLMKDVALRVRETLSERLKLNPKVPRDVILHLGNDVESVAIPVLKHSPVFSDADLVSIIERSPDMGKPLAISTREKVSTRVSDALVETQYAQVMLSLLKNEGAVIGDRSLEKIAEDFRNDAEMAEALAHQPKLPIAVVDRIITKVSSDIATQLRVKYKLQENDVAKDAAAAREDFMLRLLDANHTEEEVGALIEQMAVDGRLNPSMVMTALCRGQLMFFTNAMANFAKVPMANAKRLIEDRGEHGFAGLYKKSGLPESMMEAIRLLLRCVQDMEHDSATPGTAHYANRLVERVIVASGNKQIEYLPYFIALIRQNVHR